MLRSVVIFVGIISTLKYFTTAKTTEESVDIDTRIELLKRQIIQEIKEEDNQHEKHANLLSDHNSDNYEYIDEGNRPITPIMEFDKRKLKNRFKMPEIKSTTTDKYIASDVSVEAKDVKVKSKSNLRNRHAKEAVKSKVSKPKDIFYRRAIFDNEDRNKPQKWTHCMDLITPFLNGYKENMTDWKHVEATDTNVVRLAQLLSIDVSMMSKEDVRSILYQISNLHLRIYQWDVNAIKSILNVIIKEPPHNFKSLKHGLKAIFEKWKLDTSDTSVFLKQSRVFRPPCIQVSEFSGSTLTPKVITYTKSKPTKCPAGEDSDTSL